MQKDQKLFRIIHMTQYDLNCCNVKKYLEWIFFLQELCLVQIDLTGLPFVKHYYFETTAV